MISDRLMRCTACNWTGAISELGEDLLCPNCSDDNVEPVGDSTTDEDHFKC